MGDAWNFFSILQLLFWVFSTLAGWGLLCLTIGAIIHGQGGPEVLSTLALLAGAACWSVALFRWARRRRRA